MITSQTKEDQVKEAVLEDSLEVSQLPIDQCKHLVAQLLDI